METKKATAAARTARHRPAGKSLPSGGGDLPRLSVSTREAATMLGFSSQWMRKLRVVGGGPRFCRLGTRKIGYPLEEIRAYLDSRPRLRNTSETANVTKPPPLHSPEGAALRRARPGVQALRGGGAR